MDDLSHTREILPYGTVFANGNKYIPSSQWKDDLLRGQAMTKEENEELENQAEAK